ncbi:MAG TPA: dTDP-glucose 4,6-dehydratase [Candidatus Omnitrophica bacterium]|nr:dTDP-glucose 4,6-dehydratase [Candidatus Omnitrophota bacterium]
MKVAVTGGCGFIGSNLIRHLIRETDYSIICVDRLSYSGNPANIDEFRGNARFEFVQADICDVSAMDKVMSRVDGVINLAAETHVDRSIDDADDFLRTNILGAETLMRLAKKYSVKRFLHMSTDEVYGSIAQGKFTEASPIEPNSPYSASKASADLLIRAYRETYGYSAMITRCTNNYGPYQYPEKVIPLFVTNLLTGKKVPLYGTGVNRRDWIHVEDAVRALYLVFEKGNLGEVYNIGSDNELSNLELTHAILKNMGFDESRIEYVADRPGHDLRYALDFSKVKALGFSPRYNVQDGLKHTIEWYQSREDWWKPLKQNKYTNK